MSSIAQTTIQFIQSQLKFTVSWWQKMNRDLKKFHSFLDINDIYSNNNNFVTEFQKIFNHYLWVSFREDIQGFPQCISSVSCFSARLSSAK